MDSEQAAIPQRASRRLNRLPEKPEESTSSPGRFPSWLHRSMPKGGKMGQTSLKIVRDRLHTVCEEARCPNILECYSKKTATFLLLGKQCTRACGFCSIDHAKAPSPPDVSEPMRIVGAAQELGLRHVVLTMVARDDLRDGGAGHVVATIKALREHMPKSTCEVLVSDFLGSHEALLSVLTARPEVFNHNLETVVRLTPRVRHTATYERSLSVLQYAKENSAPATLTKSGIMVGLGETEDEVLETLRDLRAVSVDIVTIGQYLQSGFNKLSVHRFVTPQEFERYRLYGESIGIPNVYAGPLVRSSYNAALFVEHGGYCQLPLSEERGLKGD